MRGELDLEEQIPFAIIGSGWRADFYLRIAQACPERFRVTGMLVRRPEKAEAIRRERGVNAITGTIDDLLKDRPRLVVTSVPWSANADLLAALTERGAVVLSETPPAPDIDSMHRLWALIGARGRVQIAEQYPFQPLHAARIAIAASGKLGSPSHASVSAAHGYHGVALIRRLLGIDVEMCEVRGSKIVTEIVEGPERKGPPAAERIKQSEQSIALLRFESGRSGVFDFTGDQYFSYIRSPRVLVRGERGEINNEDVRYLQDYATPIHFLLQRADAGQGGNLQGYYHVGYQAGGDWVYRNPLAPARLADDEIAIGECLIRTAQYADGGDSYYGLREGLHDHYLGMTIGRACAEGAAIRTEPQPWN